MDGKEYGQTSDEELIIRLREGEEQITDFIMDKYKNLVRSKAKAMFILGADNEDLIQEGMIGLFKAIRDYDSGRDASFYTFADLCISRQMYTAVRASNRQKHVPLNNYISLYASPIVTNEEAAEAQLVEALHSITNRSPEELFFDKENAQNLEQAIDEQLSVFEKEVLDLYMTGMRNTEISKVLGKDEKSTDNALQRIKGKIKRML